MTPPPTSAFPRRLRAAACAALAAAAIVLLSLAVTHALAYPADPTRLPFGFGPVLESLRTTVELADRSGGEPVRAGRMPLLPWVLAAGDALTGGRVPGMALLKNLLFLGATAAGVAWLWRRQASLVTGRARWLAAGLLALPLLTPPWVLHAFSLVPEEGLVLPLLTLAAVAMVALEPGGPRPLPRALLLGLLAALLYLAKSSLLPFCLALAVAGGPRAREWKAGGVVLLVLGIAVGGWTLRNGLVSGRFSPGTSLDGWNLHKGNNARVAETYPTQSLDVLSPWLADQIPPTVEGEWARHDSHRAQGLRFLREHPGTAIRNAFVKSYVLLLRVEVPDSSPGSARWLLEAASVPGVVFFRVLLWSLIALALRELALRRPLWREALAGLLLVAAYALPCVVGFCYQRHAMALLGPVAVVGMRVLSARKSPH